MHKDSVSHVLPFTMFIRSLSIRMELLLMFVCITYFFLIQREYIDGVFLQHWDLFCSTRRIWLKGNTLVKICKTFPGCLAIDDWCVFLCVARGCLALGRTPHQVEIVFSYIIFHINRLWSFVKLSGMWWKMLHNLCLAHYFAFLFFVQNGIYRNDST